MGLLSNSAELSRANSEVCGNTAMPNASAGFDTPTEFERILFERLSKFRQIAFRYLDNSEDAQDAVQDALLSAFRHASQFQQQAQLSTWLHRIVINSALMKLRTRRRHEAVSLDETTDEDDEPLADRLTSSGPSPEQLCEGVELRDNVAALIRRLPPKQREAFLLCAVEGYSLREAAQRMGIGESALKCYLVRARKNLRKPLDQRLHRSLPAAGPVHSNDAAASAPESPGADRPSVFPQDGLTQASPYKLGTAVAA